jgi:hypothetical protein
MATLEYNQAVDTSDALNIGSFKVLKGQFNYDQYQILREDENAEICFWVRHCDDYDTAYSGFNVSNEAEALKAHKEQAIEAGFEEDDLTDYAEAITEAEALVAKFG